MEMMTREGYVQAKSLEWALVGSSFKDARESLGLSAAFVASGIGISESTLRRFENGTPVMAARVIEKAYEMFLYLHKAEQAGFSKHVHAPELHGVGARLVVDWELGDETAVTVSRIGGPVLAKFDIGDFDANCTLAIDLCDKLGEPYFVTY
ncbi:helix-turn-helix domain-containing protein [Paenibacillus bouchesdurhonensis]|uniref:helix-turn-helix domain-containing protein n=1 Tax=Paenibacillus bouchesdurhonensis TaxID=1870990 RepID=UPI000DA62AF5|nr:helix-turn-helix transcriptional regulator [Paenibacillus bouchesdurhonensis]